MKAHVICLGGYAAFRRPSEHSWNWFVDEGSDRIVALDLTGADWLLDRQRADSILNRGFDGSRYEYVDGRLLYRPPCGDVQQDVPADVIFVLRSWNESHPEFVVGGNEAGVAFGRDKRAGSGNSDCG